MQPMQFGQIDALTVEAEAPAEGRHQKADRDDAPALVAGRGLIDDDRNWGLEASIASLCSKNPGRSQVSAGVRSDRDLMLRSLPNCQIPGSGNSGNACAFARRLAHEASISTASPSSTGGNTTMLTADQP